ncbi:SusC/RagA family TonB-linked outer membrane protein [Formosa undariae]|uniref:SusC/RagA family TonB-linked outer membrane protein n=1 Tax=Formosa undariae TaxID=1325436 RepID=A0ABV5F456_9FLAO
MKKKLLLFKLTCLFFVLFSAISFAQNKKINGIVTDDANIPLPGVNVVIEGTQKGTVTDFDGNYTISADIGQTLIFTYIGFKPKHIVVGNSNNYAVNMQSDNAELDEVVIVGYGTQKKSDITGSVASLAEERLEIVPNTNVAQALQGGIPGVVVTNQGSSASGSDVSIVIRGRNSLKASTTPLIVLDGIPYSGSLSDITPTDILSMEVLKDVSATAIYGSRGSNGVILITSKKGKQGKVKLTYDGYYGVLRPTNLPNVLSASEFYDFKLTRDPSSITDSEQSIYDSGEGVDWLDLSLRQGQTIQHNLSASGGSDDFKYYISGSYLDVEGIRVNDNYERSTLRFNLDANVTKWLKVGTNTQLSFTDQSGLGPSFSESYYMNPLTKSHDENGDLTLYPWTEDVSFTNPLENTLAQNEDKRYKVISNLYLDFDLGFIPGLSYRLNTGVEVTNTRQESFWGLNTVRGITRQGDASVINDFRSNVLIENILNYKKEFGKSNLFVTGLYSYQNDVTDNQDLDSSGFPTEALTWRQANVARLIEPGYQYDKRTTLSSMLRINYGYDDRYMLTLTGRRDGYSAFGDNNKYVSFFSVGSAWNIHNEKFMEESILSTLKLRASYGENGNQAIDPYESLTFLNERSYVTSDGVQLPGYIPENELGNSSLTWETSVAVNFGLDYALLNNRIRGSVDLYRATTNDLLADQLISPFHGATEISTNIGSVRNEGLEFALGGQAIGTKDFSLNLDGNIAFNRNEILNINGSETLDDVGNGWFIGQPISVYYALEYDGVWQESDDIANSHQPNAEPGYAKIKDQLTVDTNGDGVPDEADGVLNTDSDRVIIGQRDPKTVASFSIDMKYKGFGLYVMSQGAFGHVKQNGLKSDDVWTEVRRNTTLKDWWTPENPTNNYYANDENANTYGVNFYESGDYWRIKDITVSYDLDQDVLDKIGIDKFKIYLAGRNLFTFTNYGGLDPELSGTRDVPLQKTYTLGFTVNF